MCFTGFAFADGHLEAEEGEHPNPNYVEISGDGPQGIDGPQGDDGELGQDPGAMGDSGDDGEEGGMAPPVDGSLPEGGGPNKAGLPPQ